MASNPSLIALFYNLISEITLASPPSIAIAIIAMAIAIAIAIEMGGKERKE